jgi:hypothetical protein
MSKYLVIGLLMVGCAGPTWSSSRSAIVEDIKAKNPEMPEPALTSVANCAADVVVDIGDRYKCELSPDFQEAFKNCIVKNNAQHEVGMRFGACVKNALQELMEQELR